MKFKTTQQKETELDIPIPSFYKEPDPHNLRIVQICALLDKFTFCSVWESDKRTCVENRIPDINNIELTNAFLNWERITEEEFLTIYDRAITSMSLTPQLIKENKQPVCEDDLKEVL